MTEHPLAATQVGNEVIVTRSDGEGPTLAFTIEEWRQFIRGVHHGDFDPPPPEDQP